MTTAVCIHATTTYSLEPLCTNIYSQVKEETGTVSDARFLGVLCDRCYKHNHPDALALIKRPLMGNSTQKILCRISLTSGIHKAQLTWTHLVPLRVGLRAPPLLGQSRHLGWTPSAQVRHSQFPWGTFKMP